MLDNIQKTLALVTVGAVVIVSVFNLGYFSEVGMHFIGVMDISNIIYPVAFVFGILLGACFWLTGDLFGRLGNFAKRQDAEIILYKIGRVILFVSTTFFAVGLFLPRYFSVLGLFSICFSVSCLFGYAYGFIVWKRTGTISAQVAFSLVVFTLITTTFVGAYYAQQQAYYAKTTYDFVTKTDTYSGARIIRASSSGFLIARQRTIIFVPMGEIKSVTTIGEP